MSHKLNVGQAVVPSARERSSLYEVVRLMPAGLRGEPRYQIRCRLTGLQRFVAEAEIQAAFPRAP
jgi:hypothetical protein